MGDITSGRDLSPYCTSSGVPMARNAYAHQAREIEVDVCFYTAFLVYVGNMFDDNIEAVRMFNHRSSTGRGRAMPCSITWPYSRSGCREPWTVVANIMTTATPNLVTGIVCGY
ncbi:hypothetical protein DL764_006567 [Monosporascus ibericus]|uniref:Uncharacterized protein n=1 Tax=Monosporascus ibericus TaxID=155417 RepID=A0A4Q4T4P5_9PEZI|nr:hypothetical protein DL764_006567 [Monosporascus ibericus]